MTDKTDVFRLMGNMVFLKKYTIFSGCNTDELRTLAFISREIVVRDGDCVVREDDAASSFFIVKKGRLRVVNGKGNNAVELGQIPENECFGEMALFEEGKLRSASVCAKGECTLLEIQKNDLFEAMMKAPGISIEMLKLFASRLRDSNRRLLEQTKHS